MYNLLLRLLKPNMWVTGLFLLGVAVAFFSLGFSDYFLPFITFLDSDLLSFQFGELRFSAYWLSTVFIVFVMLCWVAQFICGLIEKCVSSLDGIENHSKPIVSKIAQIVVYVITIIVGLNLSGIDLTTLGLFSGAVGIGIGFGLQKITSNYISGLILLFEKTLRKNDLIELSDGTTGMLDKIGARYTRIKTFSDKELIIPNETFITNHFINWTYSNKKTRLEVVVPVAYDTDLDLTMRLIVETATAHQYCLIDPAPACYIRTFGPYAIQLVLYFWLSDVMVGYYSAQSEIMLEIVKKFKENDIIIPVLKTPIVNSL